MNKRRSAPLFFMVLTILIVTLFQLYWLQQQYRQERHLFTVRTNILFRETVLRLQASRLHLDSNIHIRVQDKEGIINMTNILLEKAMDSTRHQKKMQAAMVITMNTGSHATQQDSNPPYQVSRNISGGPVFDFLAGVDSLRDSITIQEVTSRYAKALRTEKIALPFVIAVDTLNINAAPLNDLADNKVQVGFAKPRIYQLNFIHTSWYIIRQMWQPVLISILLVGITTASFFLLYRNLVRQQKLTQFKNDFISNITHELKTPIATVSVAIEALKNFNALQDPQRTKEYLDISGQEMQRLSLLVDKVLKFSLYENKAIVLNKEAFSLVELASEVTASLKLQLDKSNAIITIGTSGENFIITADRLHVASVLYSLLDNALKYSTANPVIAVSIIDHAQYIEMTVSDNGIGIAPEYKRKIFEKFFRIPGGNRHNIKGYGLGLSYVSHIVQLHHGFVEVNSKPGLGSSFSINLPFQESPVIDYGNGKKLIKEIKLGRS